MDKKFREAKYQNESGSKKGQYFLNRIDYFQFHQYPKYSFHKTASLIIFILSCYLLTKLSMIPTGLDYICFVVFSYTAYVSLVSFNILRRQICRYSGYIFYPKKWLAFFRTIEKDVDVKDFDSCATLEQSERSG